MGTGASDIPVWGSRLSGINASIWRASVGNPVFRAPMTGVVRLDGTPDVARLRQRFERLSRSFPVLRQRVVSPMAPVGNPRLVVDPSFDIAFHVRHVRLPSPGTWQQVLDFARTESLQDFDRDRPLWRAVLLEGLPNDGAALVMLVHHALADGLGLIVIASGLIDYDEAQDTVALPQPPKPGIPDPWLATVASAASEIKHSTSRLLASGRTAAAWGSEWLAEPGPASRRGLGLVRSAVTLTRPFLRPESALMAPRGLTYSCRTLDLPLDGLKAAARANDGSTNDMLVAGVLGGLRRYHEHHEAPVGALRVNLPISVRRDGERADTNAVVTVRVSLDAAEPDLRARVVAVQRGIRNSREQPMLEHLDVLSEASRAIHPSFLTPWVTGSDITVSNVPGVPMAVTVLGCRVLRAYPLVATLGAAANITLMTYAGEHASLGVTTDDRAITDADVFRECLVEGFAEAGVPVSSEDMALIDLPRAS